MGEIAEKDAYEELTDLQKKVVDELIDDPTAQNTEIAERAGVSRSTVYNVKEHYGHIVDAKLNDIGRHDGSEETRGDPFAGELASPAWQTFDERPYEPDEEHGESETDEPTLELTVDRCEIVALLDGDVPESLATRLLNDLLTRAFEE